MKTKQRISIRLISMLLSVLMLVSSLPIQTHAINFDKRTKIIKSAISKSKQIIMQNPTEESTESFPYETAYKKLNSKQKKIYNIMYKTIKAVNPLKLSKNYKKKDIDAAYDALWTDYPLLSEYIDFGYMLDKKNHKFTVPEFTYYDFFTDGKHKYRDKIAKTKKQRKMLRRKVDQYTNKIDKYVDMIVKEMPSGISTIDKYRYLAACLCYITKYNTIAANDSDINPYVLENPNIKLRKAWSYDAAFAYGFCVCEGYSLSYNYLCKKANLYSIEVSGDTVGGRHAWNLVKLNKGTYYVDVTWMDSNPPDSEGWYRHFMMTQSEVLEDHLNVYNGVNATGKYSFRNEYYKRFNR